MLNLTPIEIIKVWGLFSDLVQETVADKAVADKIELAALGGALGYYGLPTWVDRKTRKFYLPWGRDYPHNLMTLSTETVIEALDEIDDGVGILVAALIVPRFYQYCGAAIPVTKSQFRINTAEERAVAANIGNLLDRLFATGAGYSVIWIKRFVENARLAAPSMSIPPAEMEDLYEWLFDEITEVLGSNKRAALMGRYLTIMAVYFETGYWIMLPGNLSPAARHKEDWANYGPPVVPGWKYLIPGHADRKLITQTFSQVFGDKYGELVYPF